jgi:hypothetical protein
VLLPYATRVADKKTARFLLKGRSVMIAFVDQIRIENAEEFGGHDPTGSVRGYDPTGSEGAGINGSNGDVGGRIRRGPAEVRSAGIGGWLELFYKFLVINYIYRYIYIIN